MAWTGWTAVLVAVPDTDSPAEAGRRLRRSPRAVHERSRAWNSARVPGGCMPFELTTEAGR